MANQVFREKNLNRIASAEDLHECMHVTSPRLWMVLITILALIIGFIVFASLVSMEEIVDTTAYVDYNEDFKEDHNQPFNDIELKIPDNVADAVKLGMDVRIAGQDGTIISIFETMGEEEYEGKYAVVTLQDSEIFLEKNTYDAQIIMETISPIQFLFH